MEQLFERLETNLSRSSLFLWHHSTQCLFAFFVPLGVWLICLSQAWRTAIWGRKKRTTLFPLQNYMCMEQSRLNKLNYPVHSETYAAFWCVMEIRKVRRISFCPPSPFLNKQTFFFFFPFQPVAWCVPYMLCTCEGEGGLWQRSKPEFLSYWNSEKQEEFSMGGN